MEKTILATENVLKDFILAMNQWEVHYYTILKENELINIDNEMKENLTQIFNKFCTIKDRKYGKPNNISVGNPPVYSPDEEFLKTEELKGNKVVIYTQQKTRVKYQFRYTLQYKNEEWRIDKKEVYNKSEDKWEKYIL